MLFDTPPARLSLHNDASFTDTETGIDNVVLRWTPDEGKKKIPGHHLGWDKKKSKLITLAHDSNFKHADGNEKRGAKSWPALT